ncbi:TRAP-type C4-dicarboxylate transport system permease small subunit [Planomicrobium soli]|uniref:TRAP-type C4-dicarboxylate transport system permease small subunit n=1 Tax=Planomicrobium soli TaxID=1176648 RepID=A0A2P8H5R7_9BACL|nr:TRAP transporter small permease [Planomicrobium soli]PSL41566.1 TRAP-type C4-dicarboxylate transport system permease small subunit [Planomicrobium soli]
MRKIVDRITAFLTCSLMVAMVLVACWQVFTRFVLNSPSTVTEEFLRYALVWLTMLGAAYTYGLKKHLAIVFVARKLPEKIQRILDFVVEAIIIVFIVSVLLFGGTQTYRSAMGQVSSALGMPMQYLYLSVVVAGVLFIFYAFIHIFETINKIKQTDLQPKAREQINP